MSYITPREMLCPSSLRARNYCGMQELKGMDKQELLNLKEEESDLALYIFLPIHVLCSVSTIIPIVIIINTLCEGVIRSLFGRAFFINLPKKKLCKCFLSIVVIQAIFFTSWNILFRRDFNLDKGSWYFHKKRVSRLRATVAYLNNLNPQNPNDLKDRYLEELKAHFAEISRKYR